MNIIVKYLIEHIISLFTDRNVLEFADNINIIEKYNSDDDNYFGNDEHHKINEMFFGSLKNYSPQYFCFQVEKSIFIVKKFSECDIFNKKKYNKKHCLIKLLVDNDMLIPSIHETHITKRIIPNNDNYDNMLSQTKTEFINENTFVVYKNKILSSITNKKYTEITVAFKEPLHILQKKNIDDIYLKFIVNGTNYASLNNNNKYSFDFRLNKFKLFKNIVYFSKTNDYQLLVIYGFSYFVDDNNYKLFHGSNKNIIYEHLPKMLNKLLLL